VLDHPAGGNRCAEAFRYGLGREGLLVAFLCKKGSLQLSEGLGAAVVVIGFQLLGELADGGGELQGLDAELPEGTRSLQGAGGPGGLGEGRSGGDGENGHGLNVRGEEGRDERRGDRRSGGEGLGRERRRHFHHHHRHRRPGGAAAGLLHQRGRAGPTGKGEHQHRSAESRGGVGLGLDQGLLQQEAIADRTGSPAMAAPISGEGLDPPTELLSGTADGAISATGPAMQQQVNRPASRALEQGRGDALLGPDEITATSGDDDDRAMGQRRRRQEAKGRQCSGLGHCSRGQAHGLLSKRTGQVVRGLLIRLGAAGDGLVAFGAALILPVQTH
jgi:hypothetical protein